MASSHALATLMELVERELEQAAERLGHANRTLMEAEEKGGMLYGYRQDYVDNFATMAGKGLPKEAYGNYQNFLGKLEQAIQGQQEVIVNARYQVEKERELWQEVQRKKLSYEVLIKRQEKKAHQQAQRKDQKMMDEYALRAKHKKHG